MTKVSAYHTNSLEYVPNHRAVYHDKDTCPDGKRIVTASRDGTARVWDANTGAQLSIALDHGGSLTGENHPQGGAEFVLELPVEKPA